VIIAIAGRRAATTRILLDAVLGDVSHGYTDNVETADLVVLFDDSVDMARLAADTVVVAYGDDAAVATAAAASAATVVTVGLSTTNTVRAESVVTTIDGTSFDLVSGAQTAHAAVGIVGESIVPLALAALAASAAAGVATADAIVALAAVKAGAAHDMRIARPGHGVVVIDDTADASPLSTAEALKTLAGLTVDGTRSVAVLGELDLGGTADPVESREAHDRIGRLVVRLNVSRLVVVGQPARHIHNAAGLEGSWDGESVLVDTADEAYDLLNDSEFAPSGRIPTVVLVKSGASDEAGGLADRIAATDAPSTTDHRTASA
jgi:UDP-N-acetylmuramoyl-tripeptide--D-alanyl-D-alanine ligase